MEYYFDKYNRSHGQSNFKSWKTVQLILLNIYCVDQHSYLAVFFLHLCLLPLSFRTALIVMQDAA